MLKGLSTLTKFFVFAGILFTALSILLIFISNLTIRQSFLTKVNNSTSKNIQLEAQKLLKAEDFSFKDTRTKDIFSSLFQRVKTEEIIRIKVWDAQARVIFSDDESIIGKIFTDNEEFHEAIKGETITELQIPVKTENISEKGYKQLAEIYVPITLEGNSRPVGVIETYYKLDNVFYQISETQKILVITIITFVLVSFVLLFVLFRIVVLRQTEFIRKVIDTNPSLIFVKDWNGKFALVNRATADIYNTTVENLAGKRDADFNRNKEEVKSILTSDRQVMQSLQPRFIKEEAVTNAKTGKKRWFQTIKVPILSGNSKYVLGIATDITDRKKAQEIIEARSKELEKISKSQEETKKAMLNVMEDLQEAKAVIELEKIKGEAILASIGDAVIACNKDGQIILFNTVAEALSGFSAGEIIGQHYSQSLKFIRETDEKPSNDFIADAIKTDQKTEMAGNTLLVTKDGNKIPVSDSAAPVRDVKGIIIGCVVVFRDVTREREIDKAKTEFVSLASHELRTPLTAIDGIVSMIIEGEYGKVGANLIQPLTDINTSSE